MQFSCSGRQFLGDLSMKTAKRNDLKSIFLEAAFTASPYASSHTAASSAPFVGSPFYRFVEFFAFRIHV